MGASMNELTREWLECFRDDRDAGENLADHVFWRLALHELPEGVDGGDPEVMGALEAIRASVRASGEGERP